MTPAADYIINVTNVVQYNYYVYCIQMQQYIDISPYRDTLGSGAHLGRII